MRRRFSRWLSCHRGRPTAGTRIARGWPKLSASTGTKPQTGMNGVTRTAAAACNFYGARGYQPVAAVTPLTLHPANSSGVLASFGSVTAAVGESGARPEPAGWTDAPVTKQHCYSTGFAAAPDAFKRAIAKILAEEKRGARPGSVG